MERVLPRGIRAVTFNPRQWKGGRNDSTSIIWTEAGLGAAPDPCAKQWPVGSTLFKRDLLHDFLD